MSTISNWVGKHPYILFAFAGTILILWQMLLPGYVLTWDMIFDPLHVFPSLTGLINSLPLHLLFYGLEFLFPMWVIQKILLIGLFFSLFYLPIRFFPFNIDSWARYAAAALFAVNPFVYERFLAGQWAVLFAYALLAPFFYFLLNLLRPSSNAMRCHLIAISLSLTMLLIGVFTLHIFVMVILIAATAVAVAALRHLLARDSESFFALAKYATLAALLVIIGSLYWVVPYLTTPETAPLTNFTEEHWEAFKTSADPYVGAVGNVLMLYGFWGESYPWMQSLLSPKDFPFVFIPTLLILAATILLGFFVLLKDAMRRRLIAADTQDAMRCHLIALFGVAVAAFVFSIGLADSILHNFNLWLFENISFWSGFRDTQKWSMFLALVYAYFFAAGAAYLVARVRPTWRRGAQAAFILLPFLYTFTMLGGFAGQIQPVDYPKSWYEVNAILAEEEDCTAIFLPWHQYYWLAFNNGMLTANTASQFFDCKIISSVDAEIGQVGEQGYADATYQAVSQAVTSNALTSSDALSVFRDENVDYIIFTNDLVGLDPFRYPFLSDPSLEAIYETVDNPVYKGVDSSDRSQITLFRL